MPPPGVPHPRRSRVRQRLPGWLAASLDRAWEGKSTPGRFRGPSPESAPSMPNAIRDLLAGRPGRVRSAAHHGAEFGFDNIATSLKTSPLLLEGYVTAAQRVAAMAVGDPKGQPGTTEHSISREFSQNGYIDGPAAGNRWAAL